MDLHQGKHMRIELRRTVTGIYTVDELQKFNAHLQVAHSLDTCRFANIKSLHTA